MSHPARLSLRAPPHLPFIQGWPGIPSSQSRKPAAVHGTLEVRLGSQSIKAKWVRVELRRYEALPPGFPTSSQGETWEHVGQISTVWTAPQGKDWDILEQGDFKFSLPLPDDVPPTTELVKGTGIRYELVAALCYRQKGGVFKKDSTPIQKISEPIRIVRHDLHSAWPIYNSPDSKTISNQDTTMTVSRPCTAFGPTDRLLLTASLKSMRPKPFKLKGFECHLYEIITTIPIQDPKTAGKPRKSRSAAQPFSKTRLVASARTPISESVGRGGEKAARMDIPAPRDGLLVTVTAARTFKIEYRMEVKAICEEIAEVRVAGIGYTVGPFARKYAQQAVDDIGYVDTLCPMGPASRVPSASTPQSSFMSNGRQFTPSPQHSMSQESGSRTPSQYGPNGFPPQPLNTFPTPSPSMPPVVPIAGFKANDAFRRKSSGTSTDTTTTTTTGAAHLHNPHGRPQTMPAPVTYAPVKGDPSSSPMLSSGSHDRSSQSDASHDDRNKRYSTSTTATFGRWDKDLRNAISTGESPKTTPPNNRMSAGPSSLSPPHRSGPWPTAEQEKLRLFNDARSRAIVAQSATGTSLDVIGMDGPPPEYEPPADDQPHFVPLQGEDGGSKLERSNSTNTGVETMYTALESPERPIKASSSQAGPSSRNTSPEKNLYMSASEEKELQRKRFEEAQNRVASGSSAHSSLAAVTASPSRGTGSTKPLDVNGIPRNTTGGPVMAQSAEAGPSTSPETPKASSSSKPLTEKEQMRRYYEAQDRVARSRDGTASPAMSTSTSVLSTPNMPGSWGGTPASGQRMAGSASGMSALSEKEQMRRFYEAQDRVNRAAGSSSTSQRVDQSPSGAVGSSSNVNGDAGPSTAALPTAATEKEQMKRYYEAQDRVTRAASGSPERITDGGQAQQESTSGQQNSAAGPSTAPPMNTVAKSSAFPSAAEEKEMMRKRFEKAQAAVDRRRSGVNGSATNSTESSSQPPSTATVQAAANGSMSTRPMSHSGFAVANHVGRTSTLGHKANKSLSDSGPPPPLPAKPPIDYINLLSPVEETSPSFANWPNMSKPSPRISLGVNGNSEGPTPPSKD